MKYSGINNVKTLIKYYGSGNPGYQIKEDYYYDEIKKTLMSRLSFNCAFERICIPDGGLCCEWIGTALLFNLDRSSEYIKELNALRKRTKIYQIKLSGNVHDVNQDL